MQENMQIPPPPISGTMDGYTDQIKDEPKKQAPQKPSVGRIVLVPEQNANNAHPGQPVQWIAAIITRVWSDTCINVKAFPDGDETVWLTSCVLAVEGEVIAAGSRKWIWPPRS